jgi:hypothetical protein
MTPRSSRRSSAPADTSNATAALPGLEHIARFGRTTAVENGWRAWLAHWLGRHDLTNIAPAAIAAATRATSSNSLTGAANSASSTHNSAAAGHSATAGGSASTANSTPAGGSATAGNSPANTSPVTATTWLATPVHLIASLTSLHLDRRSLLPLPATDLEVLAQDFNHTFGSDSDLHLEPIGDNQFLMRGPSTLKATTTEPALALASDLEASLPKGSGASALKRLGAELEMWLHAHPLNEARRRRGELPVSTLWIWGGGAPLPTNTPHPTPTDLAFGSDPYLTGLWHLQGSRSLPLPQHLSELFERAPTDNPTAQRAVLVAEITPLLHANPHWTVFEALADLDRRFLSPALAALRKGAVASIVVLANDRQLHIRPHDRLKFWRRVRPGLAGLQG